MKELLLAVVLAALSLQGLACSGGESAPAPTGITRRGELSLTDTSWLVRAVSADTQGAESVTRDTTLTLSFGGDGRVRGSAGCNTFSAQYDTTGSALHIGAAIATRIQCPEPRGVMEQEAGYLMALQSVSRYEIRADRLQLRTEEGSLAVELVSAVTGTIIHGGGIALPPDSRVRVSLHADSPAAGQDTLLGEQVIPTHGRQLPLLFQVSFDYADIDPQRAYSLQAVIEAPDGSEVYRTTEGHPVLTRGNPSFGVEVSLERAG